MPGPLVSVIIPTYNRSNLVLNAINSVLAQTYSHFELIVVDDASTDDTRSVLKKIGDPRIRVIHHDWNLGGAASRNTGLAAAQGDLIAFLDSDDEWLPRKLEAQVRRFGEVSSEVGLIYSSPYRYDEYGRRTLLKARHRGKVYERTLTRVLVTGSASSAMIRRSVYASVGGFDESLPAMQDMDYWIRIARMYEFDYVEDPLVVVHARNDPGRISRNKAALILARQLFYNKYRDELARANVIHINIRNTAKLYQMHIGDVREARRLYRLSIAKKPLDITTYVYYVSTFFPRSVVVRLARFRTL